MTWMLTASGLDFDLQYGRHTSVTLRDVAHHLSIINRFCGATVRPYSVAEHSLLVVEICERLMPIDSHGLMAALLHDAHEAYCNDLSTPAKHQVGAAWDLFEHRLERTVRCAFGTHAAAYEHRAAIKQADLIALATERAQLLPPHGGVWPVLMHVEPVTWVDLRSPERCAMTWQDWRNRFTDKFDELEFARSENLHPVAQP